MEDRELVTKAMLECYPYIDDMYDALTKCVEKCALDGFYAVFAGEQMRLYEQIMKYNDRKIGLYNMKYLIEKGLEEKGACLALIREKYSEGKSVSCIALKRNISVRTCYRQLQRGLKEFTLSLAKMGFEKKRLLKEFGNEPLFSSMLKKVIEEEEESKRLVRDAARVNTDAFDAISRRNNRRNRLRPDSGERASA